MLPKVLVLLGTIYMKFLFFLITVCMCMQHTHASNNIKGMASPKDLLPYRFFIGLKLGMTHFNGKRTISGTYTDIANNPLSYLRKSFLSESGKNHFHTGISVGCDYKKGNAFLGIEIDGGYAFGKNSVSDNWESKLETLAGTNYDRITQIAFSQQPTCNIGVVSRLGYVFQTGTCAYGIIGINWQNFNTKISINDQFNNDNHALNGPPINDNVHYDKNLSSMGLVLGLGVEHPITNDLSCGLEFKWIGYRAKSDTEKNFSPKVLKELRSQLPGAPHPESKESLSFNTPKYSYNIAVKLIYKF